MVQVFEVTILVIAALVFINIILNATEEKEIARLFTKIIVIVYIINIIIYLIVG